MTNLFTPAKTVELELEGLDGNAFALMGAFARQARKEQWSKNDTDLVMKACQEGDYDNLIATLVAHCE